MNTQKISASGLGRQVPPLSAHVIIWFLQQGGTKAMALDFINDSNSKGWKNKNRKFISDWKMAARQWLWKNNSGTDEIRQINSTTSVMGTQDICVPGIWKLTEIPSVTN